MRRYGDSRSAGEGYAELQPSLEKPERVYRPRVPSFPRSKLAVSCGQVEQALMTEYLQGGCTEVVDFLEPLCLEPRSLRARGWELPESSPF